MNMATKSLQDGSKAVTDCLQNIAYKIINLICEIYRKAQIIIYVAERLRVGTTVGRVVGLLVGDIVCQTTAFLINQTPCPQATNTYQDGHSS